MEADQQISSGARSHPQKRDQNERAEDDAASDGSSSSSDDSEMQFKQFIRQEIQSNLMKMSTSMAMSQLGQSVASVVPG